MSILRPGGDIRKMVILGLAAIVLILSLINIVIGEHHHSSGYSNSSARQEHELH